VANVEVYSPIWRRGAVHTSSSVQGHAVWISVQPFKWHDSQGAIIEYRGAADALLAVGCMTEHMVIRRHAARRASMNAAGRTVSTARLLKPRLRDSSSRAAFMTTRQR
jgi:hypothetical protein